MRLGSSADFVWSDFARKTQRLSQDNQPAILYLAMSGGILRPSLEMAGVKMYAGYTDAQTVELGFDAMLQPGTSSCVLCTAPSGEQPRFRRRSL